MKEYIQKGCLTKDSSSKLDFFRIAANNFIKTPINLFENEYNQGYILTLRYWNGYEKSGIIFDIVRLYLGLTQDFEVYRDDYNFFCEWLEITPKPFVEHCKFDLGFDKRLKENKDNLLPNIDSVFEILKVLV